MPIISKRRSSKILPLLFEYASKKINEAYLSNIHQDKANRYAVHSMTEKDNKEQTTTLIMYRKTSHTKYKKQYALIVFLVHPSLRGLGYGTLAMSEFIDFLSITSQKVDIVLHSLKESIPFYLSFGFSEINPTKFLRTYEDLDENDNGRCFRLSTEVRS